MIKVRENYIEYLEEIKSKFSFTFRELQDRQGMKKSIKNLQYQKEELQLLILEPSIKEEEVTQKWQEVQRKENYRLRVEAKAKQQERLRKQNEEYRLKKEFRRLQKEKRREQQEKLRREREPKKSGYE